MLVVLASVTESIVNDTAHLVRDGGLPAILLLMALSSACIPVPSEVVMLFAGFAVVDPGQSAAHHHLTMVGIIAAGLVGSMIGSWVAYAVGRGGRLELLHRHGHRIHLGPAQIERADRFFRKYGDATVLFGRLVPFLRAFVSLPAGIAEMPIVRFSVLTLIGTIPWVVALAVAGHAVGGSWTNIRSGFEYVDYVVIGLIVVGIVYAVLRRRGRDTTEAPDAQPVETIDAVR